MKQDLQVLFMVLLAVAIAFGLLKFFCLKRKESAAWLLIFAMLAIAAIMTGSLRVVLTGLILIKIFYTGNDLDRNVTMFLFLLPILPVSGEIMLPTRDIHILVANYTLLVILVFLVPVMPKLIAEAVRMERKVLLYIPLLFIIAREIPFLWSDTVDLSNTVTNIVIDKSITGKIRDTVMFFINFIVPYYAMVSWVNSHKRLNLALFAICTSGLVMMIVAFPSGVLGWDFYRSIFSSVADTFRYRDGMLRLNVNMEHSITFGYYATICFGALLAAVSLVKLNAVRLVVVIICIVPAVYFTNSKGATIGALVTLLSFFYFKMQGSSRKISSAFLVTLLILIAMPFLLATNENSTRLEKDVDISQVDSFEYRKRLAIAEMELIVQKPLFGYPDPYRTPTMEAMRQGEGIIDPVNTYLTIAMTQGVICMAMYLFIIYSGISGVARYIQNGFERQKSRRVLVGAALAATYLSISVQMIFTSFNGMIIVYFWIISGICMGVAKGMRRQAIKPVNSIDFGLIKDSD